MVENHVGDTSSSNEPDGNAGEQTMECHRKKFSLRWDFWNTHAIAFWCALLGGLLLTPLLDMPDMKPRHVWEVGIGLWLILGGIIAFFCHSCVHHLTDTSEQDARKHALEESRFKASVESRLDVLTKRADEAARKITAQGQRTISFEQSTQIVSALSVYCGQKVSILALLFDTEASRYAQDFYSVLTEAGWNLGGKGIVNSTFPLNFDNAQVTIAKEFDTPEKVPPAARDMCAVFARLGIINSEMVFPVEGVPPDEIQLRIGGRRPS